MKVTAIKAQQRDENRVSIFVDGKYCVSLTLDQLLSEKLKKDVEIDETRIKQLQQVSEEGKKRQCTLEWLSLRPRSVREFREYAYRKKFDASFRDFLEQDLLTRGLLNDVHFAEWFVRQRMAKHKSMREIQAELRTKGVQHITIHSIDTSEMYEKEAITALIHKLSKRSQYKDRDKLKQYLFRKGYPFALITAALEEYDANS